MDYKKLLRIIISKKLKRPEIEEIIEALKADDGFIPFLKETKKWTHTEHDGLLKVLELKKNTNGYYVDKYGGRISYNGIRTLKRANTELPENEWHDIEMDKCKRDYKYFRANYCFITTKTGLARPEARDYQEQLEDELLSLEDLVILYPRQSGKCSSEDTIINIRNKETGEIKSIKMGEFHELQRSDNI